MKKILLGCSFVFVFLSTSANADLLNSLIWAGTKAAATSVINSAAQQSRDKRTTTKKKRYKSKKSRKSRKKTVVYHCSAKALRASGWTESTSLAKAKKGAIRQCMKRRVSNKACLIQSCYKK